MTANLTSKQPLFRDLNADDPYPEATQIESLCMNCHANGVTRLLLTKIPFYRDVVVMSFSCAECGYENNEIQSAEQVADTGIRFILKVDEAADLNRQVVKSDFASVKIVELEFEIPSKSQQGEITTVEGIINRAVRGLVQDQHVRRIEHPEIAEEIDKFVKKLKKLKELEESFTMILEDVSGNSYIENPNAPQKDVKCTIHNFIRTKEQNHELGVFTPNEVKSENDAILQPINEDEFRLENLESEILQFRTNCNNCGLPCKTNMKMTDIPHFKEVIIMATVCEACGNKTNEVKCGGGIQPHGLHIEVDINNREDFSRDILKSETCSLSIPQLELEVGPWALGGRFTTVEGLLIAVKDQLSDPKQSHMVGDTFDPEKKNKLEEFIKKFDDILECKKAITLVLDDPVGNSFIQSLNNDNTPDDALRITHYERTFEQNEDLGINDMKTENY